MGVYLKMARGASILSVFEGINQACSLVRNIILARFLAKADFGVAALLGMVLTLLEMSGKVALGQLVIQSPRGEAEDFKRGVHFAQAVSGGLSAVLILLAAWPFARCFLGSRHIASIAVLALIPLMNAFNNLDVFRFARGLAFGRLILCDAVPQTLSTLAAWPLAAWLRDYRAVVVLLLGKAFLSSLMTHLLAERPYALRFDRVVLRESVKFGWPLLVTGFVQFGNFQGDSLVVGATYPLAALGAYSVAVTIAMAPSLAVLRIASTVGLPLLSEVQSNEELFRERYSALVQALGLIGCLSTLGMLLCGEQAVVLLFGAKYAGVGALACWLTAAQSIRIMRGAVVIAGMARGDTVNNLTSTLWRLSGLALAVVVGILKASLAWFAVAALAGEVVALAATVMRMAMRHGLASRLTALPALVAAFSVVLALVIRWFLAIGPYSWLNWPLLVAVAGMSAGAFIGFFERMRAGAFDAAARLLGFKLKFSRSTGWSFAGAVLRKDDGDGGVRR